MQTSPVCFLRGAKEIGDVCAQATHIHDQIIALFTITFSHLHYNVFERGCEAISGNFALSARNCLTSMFKYIIMQMKKVNGEKGYCNANEKSL